MFNYFNDTLQNENTFSCKLYRDIGKVAVSQMYQLGRSIDLTPWNCYNNYGAQKQS